MPFSRSTMYLGSYAAFLRQIPRRGGQQLVEFRMFVGSRGGADRESRATAAEASNLIPLERARGSRAVVHSPTRA
jgi:hypothetical protein